MRLGHLSLLVLSFAIMGAASTSTRPAENNRKLLEETQAVEPKAQLQQVIVPAPVVGPACMSFTDASLRATRGGVLCTSQYISYNTTKIICNEFKPECHQTVTEYKLVVPSAPGAGPDAYTTTAAAACQVLGYVTFGSGTVHMIGDARETCYNGKSWSSDNWWTNLVCCK